jgi:YkoY family integral membrane protein
VVLKIIGGAYLLYLVYGHFTAAQDTLEEGINKKDNFLYLFVKEKIGPFWATVVLVELMDMAFSIDNIFAAVAMTDKYWLIIAGVFMGIIAMRFVAAWFVSLIRKFPSLETSAFVVIGLLGLKLIITGIQSYFPLHSILQDRWFDFAFSGLMMCVFFIPLLFKRHAVPAS